MVSNGLIGGRCHLPGDATTRQILFMARRFSAPYQSEPVSSLATWARNLALFSVIAVVVSILIVRFGFLEMKPALATFFGALACAALSILVGLAAFRSEERRVGKEC